MIVLLDTNVLIAALIARGTCQELFEHCIRHHQVISSTQIQNELDRNLVKKFRFSPSEAKMAIKLMASRLTIVRSQPLAQPICRDADDDWILAAAIQANADIIITGDNDLLVLHSFQGIGIIKPNEFWSFEKSKI